MTESVDGQNGKQIPTNEEIIETLVSDVKKSCNLNKESDLVENDNSDNTKEDDVNFSEDEEDSEIKKNKLFDFIDEEGLAIRDATLSNDDKEKLLNDVETLKTNGNSQFKNKEYEESQKTYTLALRSCPLEYTKIRSILYANRSACKVQLELYEEALLDCTKAVELDETYVRALIRKAQINENLEKLDNALTDYKKVLELTNGEHREALAACQRLPEQIEKQNEKLKEEMFGKLKDLGNMVLKPFGLSTNNFQMVQDPNTGSYSINMKK